MSGVIRVEKTSNYTVMGNYHLRDKNLSLRAKGLLSLVLALPDDWLYSKRGLKTLIKESELILTNTLKELKTAGYLKVNKLTSDKTQSGRFEYEYIFYEKPQGQSLKNPAVRNQDIENQNIEKPGIKKPGLENHSLYKYTNRQNTEEVSTEESIPKKPTLSFQDKGQSPEIQKIVGLSVIEKNGKLRTIDENGKICGGHPFIEKAYMLWEEIMGKALERNEWDSKAAYNLMRAKSKGEMEVRKALSVCLKAKVDSKADFRVKNIAGFVDLQKHWNRVIDYARQRVLSENDLKNRQF